MITLKICVGTACYTMGGAELLTIENYLSESEKKKIKIEGSHCLEACKGYNPPTPCVSINNEIIHNANIELVLEKIRALINKKNN